MPRIIDLPRAAVLAVGIVALVAAMSSAAWALGRNSVNSAMIKNGDVRTVDLAGSAVTSAKLKDNSVKSSDVADGAVSPTDIADGAVGGAQLGTIITYWATSPALGDSDGTTNGGQHNWTSVSASCPAGMKALSGGAAWVDASAGSIAEKNAYLQASYRQGNGWFARGIVDIGAQGTIRLQVYVDCLEETGAVS